MKKFWLASCVAAMSALSACGGGGGGADARATASSQLSEEAATITFAQPSLEAATVEGSQSDVTISATIDYRGSNDFWYFVEEDGALVVAGDPTFDDEHMLLNLKLQLTGDLPAGKHESAIKIHVCEDEDCTKEFQGSPAILPVHYNVKPNIHVQSAVVLQRTGRDAAPLQVVPVEIPAEAGQVTAELSTSTPDALSAVLSGSQLTVQTTQVKSGIYTGTVVISSTTDRRYRRTVDVSYKVSPPPGGEVPLTIDPPSLWLPVQAGQRATARFKVTRPSWTTQWVAPSLVTPNGVFSLRDLGNDEYEVTVNGVNVAPDVYENALRFNAGPTTGNVDVPLTSWVRGAFSVGQWSPMASILLTEGSTETDLTASLPVTTYDGVPTKWTAVAKVPWITLTKTSGITGTDNLVFKIDRNFAVQQRKILQASVVEVALDRPGIMPVEAMVALLNQTSHLQRPVSGALFGDSGRIYIGGSFDSTTSAEALLSGGYLSVNGAVVQKSNIRFGPGTLILDVSGARSGQPISVAWRTPLEVSQVQVDVGAAANIPSGYQSLPYGHYKPAQYSLSLNALYWAGEGRVFRWVHDGSAWRLAQASVEGVIDAAISSDGERLYAALSNSVAAFDPVTLAYLREGTYTHLDAAAGAGFDSQSPSALRSLAMTIDGQSFASVHAPTSLSPDTRGVVWIGGGNPNGNGIDAWDLAIAPHQMDPDIRTRSFPGTGQGSGITISAGGRSLVSVDPLGQMSIYNADKGGSWQDFGILSQGSQVAAVSDDGVTILRSDGVAQIGSNVTSEKLSALLPTTHIAGGYGLAPDGRYAFVYGYRVVTGSDGERAQNAIVMVVDLRNVTSSNLSGAKVVSSINLPDAVGCTTTLVPGETCRHTASVMTDASGTTAFVLGPRGVAAVRLPSPSNGTATMSALAAKKLTTAKEAAQFAPIKARRITAVTQVSRP